MDIALFQPDIPQNTGTILRMGACLDVAVHIIEPAGFPFSIKALRRSGMDYMDHVQIHRHDDWAAFEQWRQESRGAPQFVHQSCADRVLIPLHGKMRSLNVAIAASMVLGEALRQTDGFSPPLDDCPVPRDGDIGDHRL